MHSLTRRQQQSLCRLGDMLRSPSVFLNIEDFAKPNKICSPSQHINQPSPNYKAVGTIEHLFFHGGSVAADHASMDIGEIILEDLLQISLLVEMDGYVEATKSVVRIEGNLLLTDRLNPRKDDGRETHQLYLSKYSLKLANLIQQYEKVDSSLDLGCGLGMQAVFLSDISNNVWASDIDLDSCIRTSWNLALNNKSAEIVCSNWFEKISKKFDLIAVNPPWRLVPEGVGYPSPMTRVGKGEDGLDTVRAIIELLPNHLNQSGKALVILEAIAGDGKCPFIEELHDISQSNGLDIDISVDEKLDLDSIIERSVRLSCPFNSQLSPQDVKAKFSAAYQRLNAKEIWSLTLRIGLS